MIPAAPSWIFATVEVADPDFAAPGDASGV
jgi:hypothetical protein